MATTPRSVWQATKRVLVGTLLLSLAAQAQPPPDPLVEARQLLNARQSAKARSVLRRLVKASPDLGEAHYLLAIAIVPRVIAVCDGSGQGLAEIEHRLANCLDPRYGSLVAELWQALETALRLDPSLAPLLLKEPRFAFSFARGQLRFFQLAGLSNEAAAHAILTDTPWSADDFEGPLPIRLRFRPAGTVDDIEGNLFDWAVTDADDSGATVRITKRGRRVVLGEGTEVLGAWRLSGGTLRPLEPPRGYRSFFKTGSCAE